MTKQFDIIVEIKCKSAAEAQQLTAELKSEGFTRTMNAYWVEWWESEDTRYEIERDF